MPIKHIAIDIGGTLIEPISGDWNVTICLSDLLINKSVYVDFRGTMLREEFSDAKKKWGPNKVILSREEEYDYFINVYDSAINNLTRILSKADIEKVVYDRVYGENIYSIIAPFFNYINGIKNVRKGLFSNTYPSVIHYLKLMGATEGYVDSCLSFVEGLRKPSMSFFERLLQKTNLPAQSILVVDDSIECINVANSLGLKTVLFNRYEINQCIKEIEDYI